MPRGTIESAELVALRHEVRAFIRERIAAGDFVPRIEAWGNDWNHDFTHRLAERGWVGMTIPTEYGGHGRSFVERWVVTGELLAAGAPVAAHWVADRQAAPSLLSYGTEEQKKQFLPAIARGELSFAIGMSEPDSGSDLASVRMKAEPTEGGWLLTGAKVWTSSAHHADMFFVLARSAARDESARHAGLTQFIVRLDSPGLTINPIISMSGSHHFNEVVLDAVFVPDTMVLGTVGDGWRQVTSELAFERSGPERFMSTFPVYQAAVSRVAAGTLPESAAVGQYLARLSGLHEMSGAVAGALQRGEGADTAAAMFKILGTALEGDLVEFADQLDDRTGPPDEPFRELVAFGTLQRPGFTLKGGTSEILRGVVARGLGLR